MKKYKAKKKNQELVTRMADLGVIIKLDNNNEIDEVDAPDSMDKNELELLIGRALNEVE